MLHAKYDSEFKTRLVKLHIEEGRSVESIKKEYNLSPNGFYNFKKKRKEESNQKKIKLKEKIKEIYHYFNGVMGYRMIHDKLRKQHNIHISLPTTLKFMQELNLKSTVVRKRKNLYIMLPYTKHSIIF